MSLLHQNSMSGKNVPNWVVILRVVLGICLIYKGIDFLQHKDQLDAFFHDNKVIKNFLWFISLLPWVHIIGGLLILVGLLTRLTAVAQIPILIGAVVFVNMGDQTKSTNVSELPFSFLMLVLVIVFAIEGGGFMSLDNYIRKPVRAEED